MTIYKLVLFLIILSFSCKGRISIPSKETVTKKSTSYFSDKPEEYHYTYDTSKSEIENIDAGYIDTFSIGGTRFQLFSNPDSLGDLELQVFQNNRWVTNFITPYGINGNEALVDFNNDGFTDFTVSFLRGSGTYLYDTAKKWFHPDAISHGFDWTVIDTNKNIYADIYERDMWDTNLFTLEGFNQQYLYTAHLKLTDTANQTASLELYKYDSSGNEVFIEKKTISNAFENFNYEVFWKDFIRRKGSR